MSEIVEGGLALNKKPAICVDCESDGLWGRIFAIAAVSENSDSFLGRCPQVITDKFTRDHVIPALKDMPENYASYDELIAGFVSWWKDHKGDRETFGMVVFPVEARLFADAHRLGVLGDFEAPFPLMDLSSMEPDIINNYVRKGVSDPVAAYNRDHGIEIDGVIAEHNPLYDVKQAMAAYQNLL